MKYIDTSNWPREQIFNFFNSFDYPHFNITTNLDITNLKTFSNNVNISLFQLILYVTSLSINTIPELKQRIRGNKVIEHDVIHPSFTVLTNEKVFNFCTVDFIKDPATFFEQTKLAIKKRSFEKVLGIEYERDDLVYISCLPWIAFTGVSHPINMKPVDSVPRITWGKYIEEERVIKLPYSLQVHHALADGLHAGMYFENMQKVFSHPEKYIQL